MSKHALKLALLVIFMAISTFSCCRKTVPAAPVYVCPPSFVPCSLPVQMLDCNPCYLNPTSQGYTIIGSCYPDPYCVCNCCPVRWCPCKPRACLRPLGGGYHPAGCRCCR